MNVLPLSPVVIISHVTLQRKLLQFLQVLRNTAGLNAYLGLFTLCKKFVYFTYRPPKRNM